ncbi:MAG: restriction endonuclease subunit S, partial [Flavobacteriales bacterium]|nr:restriction endonuclease subunit S [Flavobacteriales bacterium]
MKPAVVTNKKNSGTKSFYDSVIPNDWHTPVFGSIFTFLKTFSFAREQLTNEPTDDKIRNIHYGDIHATYENEILDLDIENRIPYLLDGLIDPKCFDDKNFPALKDGDLIIADASEDYEGVCDCIELKNINGAKVVAGLHTFAARANENVVALGFRTYVLKNQQVIRELRRIATGTSVYSVSKNNLSKVKIALPPLPEQKAIARVLSTWDEAIHKTEQLIAQKELQKKWLMQQLLTGKKRLKGFSGEWKKIGAGVVFKSVTKKGFADEELLSATQDKGMIPR